MTAILIWLAAAASYLVLAGQVSVDESAAGALAGVGAVLWHRALIRAGARPFRFDRKALVEIGRSLGGLPSATVKVGWRLAWSILRPANGARVERAFAGGRHDDPWDAGRRAVVVLATSLAPDAYVVRLPPGEQTIDVHAITGHVPGGDPRWPA